MRSYMGNHVTPAVNDKSKAVRKATAAKATPNGKLLGSGEGKRPKFLQPPEVMARREKQQRKAKNIHTTSVEVVKSRGKRGGGEVNEALRQALRYAKEDGIRVFPLRGMQKMPAWEGWIEKATTDPKVIKQWAEEYRRNNFGVNCNFGLATGEGLVVFDEDKRGGLDKLFAKLGIEMPVNRTHTTPREGGGRHLPFRTPPGYEIHSDTAGKLMKGVDVKGWRSFTVCPGSMHVKTQGIYSRDEAPINMIPEALLNALIEINKVDKDGKRIPPTTRAGRRREKIPADPRHGEHETAFYKAGVLLRKRTGSTEEELSATMHAWNASLSEPARESTIRRAVKSAANVAVLDSVQTQLDDPRPKVLLPGDGYSLSETAADLGEKLHDAPIFVRNDEVVAVSGKAVRRISAQSFCSWPERYVMFRKWKKDVGLVVSSPTEVQARQLLASRDLHEHLRPLRRVHTVCLPVKRADGRIELLKEGYDKETATLTLNPLRFDERMSLKRARAVFDDLFREFIFTNVPSGEGKRSRSVVVAALVGMFANQLINAVRPGFVVTKNRAGAGASTLATAVAGLIHGVPAPTTPWLREEEMRKFLHTAAREGWNYVIFDNVKTTISGEYIEQFMTSSQPGGRLLGGNEMGQYPNHAYPFFTSNGAKVGTEMQRRTLVIDLFQPHERPEDRKWERPLTDAVLEELRADVLGAVWALTRHWDQKGRPDPTRSNSHFAAWSKVVGGIVEAAGFGCPLLPPPVSLDEDDRAVHELVKHMDIGEKYTYQRITGMCGLLKLFEGLVQASDPSQRSKLGIILGTYKNLPVGDVLFRIEGDFHQKRYWVEARSARGGDASNHAGKSGKPGTGSKVNTHLATNLASAKNKPKR